MAWQSTLDGTGPDWRDIGKRVELRAEGGRTLAGVIECDDFHFNGEDEVPHLTVAGKCVWDFDEWRVLQ